MRAALSALAALLAPARAEADEQEDLERLVAELIPEVEASAGRAFHEIPELVLAEPEQIRAVLQRERAHLLGRLGDLDPAEAERRAADPTGDAAGSFVGKYGFLDKKLYVLRGGVDRALAARGLPPALADQVTELVLAHELVHALQDQQVDLAALVAASADGDGVVAVNSTVEGHAVWVQERVGLARGHEVAVREVAAILGYDPRGGGAIDPRTFYTSYVYGRGRDFVAHHADARGLEGTWDLLAHPPARSAMILDPERYATRAEPPFDRRVRAAVGRARDRLAPAGWVVEDEAVGDYALRERVAALPFGHLLPLDWREGWSARASGSPIRWVEVQVLSFRHAAAADAYVAGMALQAEVDLARTQPPLPGALAAPQVDGRVAPFAPMADEAAEQRFTVALEPGDPPQEFRQVWASRGDHVVQVAIVNQRRADARIAREIRRVFRSVDEDEPARVVGSPPCDDC